MSLIKKIFFICSLIPFSLYSQAPNVLWTNTLGGAYNEYPYFVNNTSDGGFIVTGRINSPDTYDDALLLIKVSSAGNEEWTKFFDGSVSSDVLGYGRDEGRFVQQTEDGGYIAIGTTITLNGSNEGIWIIKTDANGDSLWTKTIYGGYTAKCRSANQTSDGGYIIVGIKPDSTLYKNIWLIKTDADGNSQWTKTYGGDNYEEGGSVQQTSDGGYIVTGTTASIGSGSTDCWLIKTDANGNTLWDKTFGGSGGESGHEVRQTLDGGYIITGETSSFGSGSTDCWLIKTDANGISQWTKTFGGSSVEYGRAVQQTPDSGYILTAQTNSFGQGNSDLWIIKTNVNGDTIWTKTYGGSDTDYGEYGQLTSDGGYIITGATKSFGAGQWDVWLVRLSGEPKIDKPKSYEKWIAGYTDTIKWVETGWIAQNIKCILNAGTSSEQTYTIEDGIFLDSSYYVWDVPDTLLSYQSKIVIEKSSNPSEKLESEIFRIKPYVLTRVESDSTYYAYQKNKDQWGFSNTQADMWPATWYNQFNYQGIDPFTNNLQYSQHQGDSTFGKSRSYYHPDWVSWVNTFGIDACYYATPNGFYRPSALLKWWASSNVWNGSCFGIAGTNALAFKYHEEFQSKYPNFPVFVNPVTVTSDTGVKRVVNEFFTHQFGNPHYSHVTTNWMTKSPNQTLNELKNLLKQDNCEPVTLSIWNNGGTGCHNVLPY